MKHGTTNVVDQTVSVINPNAGTVTSLLPNISSATTAVAAPYLDCRRTGGLSVCSVDTVDTNANGAFSETTSSATATITAHGYKTGLAGLIGTAATWTSGAVGTNNITFSGHNFVTGEPVTLTTTGALPTGLSLATTYYIGVIDANTVYFYDTNAHAIAGGSTGKKTFTSSGDSGTGTCTPNTSYVIVVDVNTVKFASSYANAVAGTTFGNIMGLQSGSSASSTFYPSALAGCTVVGQWSLDTVNWANIGSPTSISSTSTFTLTQDRPTWPFFRLYFVLTAGSLSVATTYYTYSDNGPS